MQSLWHQSYSPLAGSLFLSALAAVVPLVLLLGLLASGRVRAHVAAMIGLGAALIISIAIYQMPTGLAFASALYGIAYGLFPIGWIVIGAIFLYDVAVESGTFAIVKESIGSFSPDRRIQALLIAFSFGAFMEGASGFGTPVAISTAMLVGLGFNPITAAVLALLGNTAPVAFAGLGTPLIALTGVTGLPIELLSATVGTLLVPFALAIPFWIVAVMAGWNGIKETWPACVVVGGSYAVTQWTLSVWHGPWVVGIASGAVSLVSLFLFLRVWQPKTVWRFEHETPVDQTRPSFSRSEILRAWLPWVMLSVFAFVWGLPVIKAWMNSFSAMTMRVPLLDQAIVRFVPGTVTPRTEEAVFVLNGLSAAGTSLFLASVVSSAVLGMRPRRVLRVFGGTVFRMRQPLMTMAAMLGLGFTMRYAGMDTTLGLVFAQTGWMFPFFSPIVGWVGVAITGSDTSSNVLFGNLQQVTAQALGMSPLLAAAANTVGGVMGKMINAQSIVVAVVATGQRGSEGEILRRVFWHSVVLVALVGVMVWVLSVWVCK